MTHIHMFVCSRAEPHLVTTHFNDSVIFVQALLLVAFKNIITMKPITLCVVLIIIFGNASARRFSKCEMARELLRQGFPKNELSDWVCLIYSESSYETNVVGPMNTDGSYDWGLFQINDKYWCKGHYSGSKNICNINCGEFLQDDISASVKCALKIKNASGFSAWEGWKAKCQGRHFDLSDCDLGCNRQEF
ncbi:lysozyme-like [Arctopsyche grandis]|uniref:lysozyme-like n=1 Tax=Arctopsyche grandis TaxID=121162 RepID=UPI00406D7571